MINTSRRRFLFGAAALALAPALVRAESIMPISVPRLPKLYGDGIHDDTYALERHIRSVHERGGAFDGRGQRFRITRSVNILLDSNVNIRSLALDGHDLPDGECFLRPNNPVADTYPFLRIDYLDLRRIDPHPGDAVFTINKIGVGNTMEQCNDP